MGGHDDPTSIRKNVYVEGIANYRDQIHLRFWQRAANRKSMTTLALAAVAFPVFLYQMSVYTEQQMADKQAAFKKEYQPPSSRLENTRTQKA